MAAQAILTESKDVFVNAERFKGNPSRTFQPGFEVTRFATVLVKQDVVALDFAALHCLEEFFGDEFQFAEVELTDSEDTLSSYAWNSEVYLDTPPFGLRPVSRTSRCSPSGLVFHPSGIQPSSSLNSNAARKRDLGSDRVFCWVVPLARASCGLRRGGRVRRGWDCRRRGHCRSPGQSPQTSF